MDNRYKACPQCNTPAPLNAPRCSACGREYRTQFEQPREQRTQMFHASPPPVHPQQPGYSQYQPQVDPHADANTKSTVAIILAALSFFGWIIPIVGVPLSVAGIVLSIPGVRLGKGVAIAAVILSGATLIMGLINGFIGAFVWSAIFEQAARNAR